MPETQVSGMRMILFNFSNIRLLCFREKITKGNWINYQ